ncbi:MAG: FAD-binding protein [Bifidobacteriaceae bacterium]|nr:FAD-binding protein [Bifidobacteriaceae bacterium]
MNTAPRFADITTIRVGGSIARFVEPTSRVGFIEAIEDADSAHLPLCVIGGGSNLLASDADFIGVVVRDGRRDINVLDQAAPREGNDLSVHVQAAAGANWDDFVDFCVRMGLQGVEGLSGIPGTVGASVVQNIGAYGQEASGSVESVEVWDRLTKTVKTLRAAEMAFGYRSSALKESMYKAPGVAGDDFFPTPRFVVLSVTFVLQHSATGVVRFGQLAAALGVEVGQSMSCAAIRTAVLAVRARKGMLEDPTRYENPWMAGTKRDGMAASTDSSSAAVVDHDRWSCGSFFINPVVSPSVSQTLPQEAPRFDAVTADGKKGVKTSAAWLIDHAGFHKGYPMADNSAASAALSTRHTLALTNRGSATAHAIVELAHTVQNGVESAFGIRLIPEPVFLGLS